jgi:hypothetical protein
METTACITDQIPQDVRDLHGVSISDGWLRVGGDYSYGILIESIKGVSISDHTVTVSTSTTALSMYRGIKLTHATIF